MRTHVAESPIKSGSFIDSVIDHIVPIRFPVKIGDTLYCIKTHIHGKGNLRVTTGAIASVCSIGINDLICVRFHNMDTIKHLNDFGITNEFSYVNCGEFWVSQERVNTIRTLIENGLSLMDAVQSEPSISCL